MGCAALAIDKFLKFRFVGFQLETILSKNLRMHKSLSSYSRFSFRPPSGYGLYSLFTQGQIYFCRGRASDFVWAPQVKRMYHIV